MSYGELYNVINHAWASLKEIQLIAQCGRKAAEHIRDNIKNDIINSGKKLPEGKDNSNTYEKFTRISKFRFGIYHTNGNK